MFAERFDALMNVAEVSNSRLGRAVSMNPSYIGRLRSGARALPKKQAYLLNMCKYLAGNVKKDYQINALIKLTGIGSAVLETVEDTAVYLERWLIGEKPELYPASGRLVSGCSHAVQRQVAAVSQENEREELKKYSSYLYGNAGKRKAVIQFFQMILQEKKPHTLLLFSDENMEWLYEDGAFVKRWMELFTGVILKGNRVRVIHNISRDMNELIEAVTKWIPIYMTGMVEPYYYPRLRDGVFRRTLFIAPEVAAVASSSVQQDTDGMLNMFITDRFAINALTAEYGNYFGLCRPLMQIFTEKDAKSFADVAENIVMAEGDALLCCEMPPFFAMPEKLAEEMAEKAEYTDFMEVWRNSADAFRKKIAHSRLSLILLEPKTAEGAEYILQPPFAQTLSLGGIRYDQKQYLAHIEGLKELEAQYENFSITFKQELTPNITLYVKEDRGVIMTKTDMPKAAFVIDDYNMVNAFRDYASKILRT